MTTATSDYMRPRGKQRGFTLIEMMTVVAIIGVLAGIAVISVRKSSYAGTVNGYANQIASECDVARHRAVASKRWQRIDVKPLEVEHWESTTEGMAPPAMWQLVRTIRAPRDVEVVSLAYKTHIVPNDGVPSPGDNLDGFVRFAPDGAGEAATIFVGDTWDKKHFRVAIYRASGTAYVFKEW